MQRLLALAGSMFGLSMDQSSKGFFVVDWGLTCVFSWAACFTAVVAFCVMLPFLVFLGLTCRLLIAGGSKHRRGSINVVTFLSRSQTRLCFINVFTMSKRFAPRCTPLYYLTRKTIVLVQFFSMRRSSRHLPIECSLSSR